MITIHIGMPKCGSSTLQYFLRSNEDILRKASIDFPKIGRKPPENKAHHNIAYEIQASYHERFDPKSGTVAELVRHCATQEARTTVLSSELLKNAQTEEIAALKQAFLGTLPAAEFSILMIVRNLPEFLRSRYFRMVRYGMHAYDFDEFFARTSDSLATDYLDIAQRWATVFGWSAMEIRVLDAPNLRNGDILDEFLFLLGADVDMGTAAGPRRTSTRNASPGWKTVEAVRALYAGSHFFDHDHPLVQASQRSSNKRIGKTARRVGDKCGWNEDKGIYLNKQQLEFCINLYCDAINSLNRFLSKKLPLPDVASMEHFRDSIRAPSADMISRKELEAFYEHLWWRISKRARTGERGQFVQMSAQTSNTPGVKRPPKFHSRRKLDIPENRP